ncbi:hypothetical protein GCM10018966_003280 [Streptomyces yanii]
MTGPDGLPECHASACPGGRRGFFPTWGELQDYVGHDPAGGDLQPLVDLVDTHGTRTILRAIDQLGDEHTAEVSVSTAHKEKSVNGRVYESLATSSRRRTATSTTTRVNPSPYALEPVVERPKVPVCAALRPAATEARPARRSRRPLPDSPPETSDGAP